MAICCRARAKAKRVPDAAGSLRPLPLRKWKEVQVLLPAERMNELRHYYAVKFGRARWSNRYRMASTQIKMPMSARCQHSRYSGKSTPIVESRCGRIACFVQPPIGYRIGGKNRCFIGLAR